MLKENLISSLKANSVNPPIEPPDTEHNWIIRELTSQNVVIIPEDITEENASDMQYLGFSESLDFGQPFPDLKECYLDVKNAAFVTSAKLAYFALSDLAWETYNPNDIISIFTIIFVLLNATGKVSETDENYNPPPYYIAYTVD